ncbi:UNVERIFIED_CONTAM: hypothetical protein HDU68_007383 [Siphonaria sp. JEL0065]|nr:hypothetical protein HDU68_007383 [Siphonaria sp. JEL0065]
MKPTRKQLKLKRKQDEYESDSGSEDGVDPVRQDVEGEGEGSSDGDDIRAHEDEEQDAATADQDDDNDLDPDAPSKKQTKLAYAMARILGSALTPLQQDSQEVEKPKAKKQKKENPILSKHKSIEVSLDDQKLEEKAKRLINKEKKVKLVDVARIKREDLVAVNDLEKRLKKVATRGVVKLFNAIRVAQKSVEAVKSDGVQKHSAKLTALSQGGFMQMIKEGDSKKKEEKGAKKPDSTAAATTLKTVGTAGGGGVPWIDDDFMLKNPSGGASGGGGTDKAWDMDSD